MDADPIAQYRIWLAEAELSELNEPNAACLATVDAEGRPRARMVLVKHAESRGFSFFTNYESDKGRELSQRPEAAICVFWKSRHRQIRIEGSVEPMEAADSDIYFSQRPRGSQVGAWASDQSRPIDSRAELAEKFAAAEARFEGVEVPRPPHWGGYWLRPRKIEFWQGRENRYHDRWVYEPVGEGDDRVWQILRLQP